MDRTLHADGLTNARDLGGLPRRDGSVTPSGVFFRAENVDRLTPAGWDRVYAAGVRSVVDLRQPAERDQDTSPRPGWLTTRHVDHDGLDEHPEFWVDYWETGLVGTALYYLPHLAALPERTGAVLAALADAPEGGVLFHCMAGRDRTGLIAAILLSAVDTEPEAIVDDYLETVRRASVGGRRGTARTSRPSWRPSARRTAPPRRARSATPWPGWTSTRCSTRRRCPTTCATRVRTWRGSVRALTTHARGARSASRRRGNAPW